MFDALVISNLVLCSISSKHGKIINMFALPFSDSDSASADYC